jgi:hypothetical protein
MQGPVVFNLSFQLTPIGDDKGLSTDAKIILSGKTDKSGLSFSTPGRIPVRQRRTAESSPARSAGWLKETRQSRQGRLKSYIPCEADPFERGPDWWTHRKSFPTFTYLAKRKPAGAKARELIAFVRHS